MAIISKKNKIYLVVLTVISALIYSSWVYVDFIHAQRTVLEKLRYKSEALAMRERVAGMILTKQKATVAMALSLADDKNLKDDILDANIDKNYYKDLITKYKKNTLYQNIWIQIIDKDLISRYRSWTDIRDDDVTKIRRDVTEVIATKKVTYTIGYGKFDLSIKAIVPILKDGVVIGVLELISHFNSISLQMKKYDIDSVVILNQ